MTQRMPRRSISQRSELLHDIMNWDVLADTREIFLHSSLDNCVTDEEIGIDWRMADRFNKTMAFLEYQDDRKPILIHVCSHGGEWEYGISIFDRIIASSCPVTTLSHAHARSMSSILIQAADLRVLMPNCLVLIHFGAVEFSSNTEHILADAEQAKLETEKMLKIYAERCAKGSFFRKKKYSRVGVANFLRNQIIKKAEWYMSGREAIDFGFADAVLGDPRAETIAALVGK